MVKISNDRVVFIWRIILLGLIVNLKFMAGCTPRIQKGEGGLMKIAENEGFVKGGIGMMDDDLFVDLNSKKNELVLASGKRWVGNSSNKHQLVFIWCNSIIDVNSAPKNFKIADSVAVSFEGEKILFMNFKGGYGGYYKREVK